MTLDEAVRIEDALDSMKAGITRKEHVACVKPEFQGKETVAWYDAEQFVKQYGTIRKALNAIRIIIRRESIAA
jgi:hypothetical protein